MDSIAMDTRLGGAIFWMELNSDVVEEASVHAAGVTWYLMNYWVGLWVHFLFG